MSRWASACSSDNYIDRLPPLFHAPTRLPQTHAVSAYGDNETTHHRRGRLLFCRFPDDPSSGLVLVLAHARVFSELHTYIPLGLVVLVCGGLELHIADFADTHGSRSLPSYHSHLSFRHALSLRRSFWHPASVWQTEPRQGHRRHACQVCVRPQGDGREERHYQSGVCHP